MTDARQGKNAAHRRAATLGGATAGGQASAPDAAASDVIVMHMRELRDVGAQYARLGPAQAKGFMYEHILAAKFNADAARKGLSVRAEVTSSNGDPHAAADLLITEGGTVLQRVQAKASESSTALVRYLNEDKYAGMTKVVPSERVDHVRDIASGLSERHAAQGKPTATGYADTAQNVVGELAEGGARSGRTTHGEALAAARHPEAYAKRMTLDYLGKEVATACSAAATAGALLGGALSGARNTLSVLRGETSAGEAVKNVALDAGRAGVRAGMVGAGGAVVRNGASQLGLGVLARANVAAAAAAAAVETGATVLSYARGELSGHHALILMGQTGASTVGGIVGGLTGGLLGPSGAVVGSVVGYILITSIYHGALAVLRNAHLASDEAERVEALCAEACRQLKAAREEFEALVDERLDVRREEFTAAFVTLDTGLASPDFEDMLNGLDLLTAVLGGRLGFTSLEKFNDCMALDGPLTL